MMLFSTFWRNGSYVRTYGLTYMRIGVYVYLVLATIGLITTAWKVMDKKSNAFLFKANCWLFHLVFIVAGFVNWDAFITKFNLSLKQEFDIGYFSQLSFRNYDLILDYFESHPQAVPQYQFGNDLYLFMQKEKYVDKNNKWPSSVMAAVSMYNSIERISEEKKSIFHSIEVQSRELKSLEYFPAYASVEYFNAHRNDLTDLGDVSQFHQLRQLDVSANYDLTSIEGIQACQQLEAFTFEAGKVKDFTPLFELPNLKTLNANHLPDDVEHQLQQRFPNLAIDTHLFSEYFE